MAALDDKVAIVTGGARGIGAGIATCLARDGAHAAILDLDGPEAERTAATLGGRSVGLACDVANEAETQHAVSAIAQRLGGVDILVNNAGAGRGPLDPAISANTGRRVEDMTAESWDEQLSQNLRTTFLVTKAALPYIKARGGGSIINIASIAGLSASPTLPAYAAAKAGVISLTRSLALEHAPADIRVNAICPGFLWTRAWEALATSLRHLPQYAGRAPREIFLEVVNQGVPLAREQTRRTLETWPPSCAARER